MPIYEYDCGDCQQTAEILVRSADDERLASCPQCGSDRLTRQMSVPAAPAAGGGSDRSLPVGGDDCGRPGGCCGGFCG